MDLALRGIGGMSGPSHDGIMDELLASADRNGREAPIAYRRCSLGKLSQGPIPDLQKSIADLTLKAPEACLPHLSSIPHQDPGDLMSDRLFIHG
jgi:hypothetical protein